VKSTTTTTRDGVRIAYDEAGSGDVATLFLPGWCSDRSQFSASLLPVMSESHRALSLDWRGHGESETPPDDFGYDELIQDAVAVVDTAGVERFVVVAAAHAGWAGIELRRRMGERVLGLVAISWMVLGAPPPFLEGLQGMQRPDGWEEVRDQLFAMWRGGGSNDGVEDQIARMATSPGEMWMRAAREISRAYATFGSPIDAVAKLDSPLPMLHVYGQPDAPELLEAQEAVTAEHDWFRVHRIDASSHFPQFERPREIAGLIESFISEVERAPARGQQASR